MPVHHGRSIVRPKCGRIWASYQSPSLYSRHGYAQQASTTHAQTKDLPASSIERQKPTINERNNGSSEFPPASGAKTSPPVKSTGDATLLATPRGTSLPEPVDQLLRREAAFRRMFTGRPIEQHLQSLKESMTSSGSSMANRDKIAVGKKNSTYSNGAPNRFDGVPLSKIPTMRKVSLVTKEPRIEPNLDGLQYRIEELSRNINNCKDDNELAKRNIERDRIQGRIRMILHNTKDIAVRNKLRKLYEATAKLSKQSSPRIRSSDLNSAIRHIASDRSAIKPVEVDQPSAPALAYGLERVLFNPGVYYLQDPRTRVFNFDPYLQKIMPIADFDFNALKDYITSSEDHALRDVAKKHGTRYAGSTSSMTGSLSHFHFLLSQWRPVNTDMMSKNFPTDSSQFTELSRAPSAIFLRWKNDSYAIDADKQFNDSNVLSMLGKSMEKLLTLNTENFERYRKTSTDLVSEAERKLPETFHYSTYKSFMMRSQLDAYNPHLPGTGMFDLKTRAVVSVRMDVANYEEGMGYQIKDRHGAWESYEREYYDMIRSAFLKYSMQVRMGRMDGIFVAFHNVEQIFGFQYISLEEMDASIHGQWDTALGDREFTLSLELLKEVFDKATKKFPKTSIRFHFETRQAATPFMYIFAEPVSEEEVHDVQSAKNAAVEEFEASVLGVSRVKETPTEPEEESGSKWADMEANIQETMSHDELGDQESEEENLDVPISDALPDLLNPEIHAENAVDQDNHTTDIQASETSEAEAPYKGVLSEPSVIESISEGETSSEVPLAPSSPCIETADRQTQTQEVKVSSQETSADETTKESQMTEESVTAAGRGKSEADAPFFEDIAHFAGKEKPVLAMTLTIRNKVNDKFVLRPENFSANDDWSIEYSLTEVEDQHRAWALYDACMQRRKRVFDRPKQGDEEIKANFFVQRLRELSRHGREWKKVQEERYREHRQHVLAPSLVQSAVQHKDQ